MERKDILNEIQQILRTILNDDEVVLTEETSANDIPGWDSFAHINMIEVVENKFNIKFTMGEIVLLKNVSDFLDLIQKKTTK